ncbi:MAG: FAD-dependent oxidoreductase [Anaerolineae bacterium]
MVTYSEAAREIPIRDEVDVIVVGGGSAGVIAAIAAARQGVRTLLIERYGFLGGLVTGGPTGLHSFFNCYHDAEGTPNVPPENKKQIIRGIPQELVGRLVAAGGCLGHIELEKAARFISVLTPVDPEMYKWMAMEMVQEAGCRVLLYTDVVDIIQQGDTVRGVIIESKSGREAVMAKTIVDTSGDADVAARAGAPYVFIEQFGIGMNLRMVGVDVEAFAAEVLSRNLVYHYARAVKLGATEKSTVRLSTRLTPWKEQIDKYGAGIGGIINTSLREGELTHMNCTGIVANGVDVADMTKASVHLHRQIHRIVNFFHDCMPGFQHAYLAATGPLLGVRRTRLMRARFDIPREYILTGGGAPDEIGRFSFIDLPEFAVTDGHTYGIPYRALLPRDVEGVLLAGRMISTDNVVHHSTRNVGCCMVTGQAAGTAAALAVLNGVQPSQLDTNLLRDTLAKQDVYFE